MRCREDANADDGEKMLKEERRRKSLSGCTELERLGCLNTNKEHRL